MGFPLLNCPFRIQAASNYAVGAEFNAWQREHEPPCLQGTRVALLEQIMRWSDNPSGPCMFWLNGRGGTGKSTIARTVALKWGRRVGASFFFSKGGGDLAHASKFVTTLACQLAVTQPDLAGGIRTAIGQHPDIHLRGLHEQWKYLIAGPLSSWNGETLILVIDALDECDSEGDTRLILQLLSRVVSTNRPPPLKIFISSTPETLIRHRFKDLSDTADRNITLLEISKPATSVDISICLRDRFGSIRKHHGLCENWPDQGCLDRLVQKADGMFIYAATVCQFVGNARTDPKERLALILEGGNEDGEDSAEEPPTGKLDKLYTTVLQRLVVAETVSGSFKQTLESIAMLFCPLTAGPLAELLGVDQSQMLGVLESLDSVLACSERRDTSVKLLHPSFRDYLLDSKRCKDPQFHVVEGETHQRLLASCIRLMSGSLKEDICSLKDPGRLVSAVDGGLIQRSLPPQVRYACRYWFDHFKRSNDKLHHHESLHELVHTFLKQHLLHWLEALSLMGGMSDGVLIVLNFDSILTVSKQTCVELYLSLVTCFRRSAAHQTANIQYARCAGNPTTRNLSRRNFIPLTMSSHVCFSAENVADLSQARCQSGVAQVGARRSSIRTQFQIDPRDRTSPDILLCAHVQPEEKRHQGNFLGQCPALDQSPTGGSWKLGPAVASTLRSYRGCQYGLVLE